MTYLKNTATLEYDKSLCTGCGMCRTVCPHNVFDIRDGKAVLLDRDRCMECGACMMNCPAAALKVEKGVGCAYAVIISKLRGQEEISCDCGCSADTGKKPGSGCC